MAKESPTSKALKWLRDSGWSVDVTEHWNHFAKKRQDLFGFCDIMAVKAGAPILYIQVTSWDNVGARVKKIVEPHGDAKDDLRKAAARILMSHRMARVEVWGFQSGRIPRNRVNLKIHRLHGAGAIIEQQWNTRTNQLQ